MRNEISPCLCTVFVLVYLFIVSKRCFNVLLILIINLYYYFIIFIIYSCYSLITHISFSWLNYCSLSHIEPCVFTVAPGLWHRLLRWQVQICIDQSFWQRHSISDYRNQQHKKENTTKTWIGKSTMCRDLNQALSLVNKSTCWNVHKQIRFEVMCGHVAAKQVILRNNPLTV